MNALLFWVVPPCAGAVIGWVTNYLAVKMLFRPLRERRFCGRRVPFTPGIIPRKRRQLARNIAVMVNRELISADTLQERFSSEELSRELDDAIERCVQSIFERLAEREERTFQADSGAAAFFSSLAASAQDMKKAAVRAVFESLRHKLLSTENKKEIRRAIRAELPRIAGALEIEKTVEERVNAMDMEELEALVLHIMSDQLKWINFFGALLGALIGLVEALLANATNR
jgi:uncharacterized membrane protein YheB (UPF0754 family)